MPDISRVRKYAAPAGLVAAGLLAGVLVSTTLSASAAGGGSRSSTPSPSSTPTASATPTPSPPDHRRPSMCQGMDGEGPRFGRGLALGRHGWRGEELTGDAATKARAAILAKYPGATIRHLWADPTGGYGAAVRTQDGTKLVLRLSTSYAVTEEAARGKHAKPKPKPERSTPPTPTPSRT